MIHKLKTLPEFWDAVADGDKTFEVRRDDRGFKTGDTLILQRWQPEVGCSGGGFHSDVNGDKPWIRKTPPAVLHVSVTYKMPGGRFGIDPDFCVLGFSLGEAYE